jgi:hypothetical protein
MTALFALPQLPGRPSAVLVALAIPALGMQTSLGGTEDILA